MLSSAPKLRCLMEATYECISMECQAEPFFISMSILHFA
jgi:hypothetical protein